MKIQQSVNVPPYPIKDIRKCVHLCIYGYQFQIRAVKKAAHASMQRSMNAYASRSETHPITKSELAEYHFTPTKKSYLHSAPDSRKNSSPHQIIVFLRYTDDRRTSKIYQTYGVSDGNEKFGNIPKKYVQHS